jgi:hypothetical protein
LSQKILLTDGVLRRHIHIDAKGQALAMVDQPSRNVIMERLVELRKSRDAVNHMEHMGLECTIPLVDLYYLNKKFPGFTGGGEQQQIAHQCFLADPISDKYRVRDVKQ